LKLLRDHPLSNFAFEFNLRRSTKAAGVFEFKNGGMAPVALIKRAAAASAKAQSSSDRAQHKGSDSAQHKGSA